MDNTPVCVSVFPFVPSELKRAYDDIPRQILSGLIPISSSPNWYPWDVNTGYMFEFPSAQTVDEFLDHQVRSTRDAFAITNDIRPYLWSSGQNNSVSWCGLWLVVVRHYGELRVWYTRLTDDRDPYYVPLAHMSRVEEDAIRAGSVVQFLELAHIG
jgi:hypothetical protein